MSQLPKIISTDTLEYFLNKSNDYNEKKFASKDDIDTLKVNVEENEEVVATAISTLFDKVDNIIVSILTEITYDELVQLRNDGKLVPGQQYRIIDYVTTTSQENTTSSGYQFDIIVTADSPNSLNESARAIHHSNMDYDQFEDCKLDAWELKYCLDNDVNRFGWAYGGGKGVIYYMKDEYGNELPYDFKNIMFTKQLVNTLTSGISKEWASIRIQNGLPTGWLPQTYDGIAYLDDTQSTQANLSYTTKSFHTFYSSYPDDASIIGKVKNVKMGPTYDVYGKKQMLNGNIFIQDDLIENVTLGNYCYDNVFRGCRDVVIGNSCGKNNIGKTANIKLGNNCYLNVIHNNAKNVNFLNNCSYNTLVNVSSCDFGNNCCYNSFFKASVVTMGDGCYRVSESSSTYGYYNYVSGCMDLAGEAFDGCNIISPITNSFYSNFGSTYVDVDIPEHVNADWNATYGRGYILNKPVKSTISKSSFSYNGEGSICVCNTYFTKGTIVKSSLNNQTYFTISDTTGDYVDFNLLVDYRGDGEHDNSVYISAKYMCYPMYENAYELTIYVYNCYNFGNGNGSWITDDLPKLLDFCVESNMFDEQYIPDTITRNSQFTKLTDEEINSLFEN